MRREILKLSACFVLCAAAGAVCGEEMKTVTKKELGFEISVPKDDYILDFVGGIEVRSGGVITKVQIVVRNFNENVELNSFYKTNRNWLSKSTVKNTEMLKIDGRNSLKLTVDREGRKQIAYYTVEGKRSYAFFVYLDAYSEDVEAFLKSFKILTDK